MISSRSPHIKILRVSVALSLLWILVIILYLSLPNFEEKKEDKSKKIKNSINMDHNMSQEGVPENFKVDVGYRWGEDENRSEQRVNTKKVHVFYYPWYSNPTDSPEIGWNHWNHNILPHWDPVTLKQFPHDIKYPAFDSDIGSSYFPARGLYSSQDQHILDQHMEELKDYVVVVSWWGINKKDGEGMSTDVLMPLILKSAEKFGTQIAIHLEPYEGRTEITIKEDLIYILQKYGTSPSLYREESDPKHRPIVYIYDSYHINKENWNKILQPSGTHTIRGTDHDFVVLGLYLNDVDSHLTFTGSGFDGVYTYFAAEGFTDGSKEKNWASIVEWSHTQNLKVSLSVGPGYDDIRIRPWNAKNKKNRDNGAYYDDKWRAAIDAHCDWISVTSYNEWMEGTQIEAATPKNITKTIYDNQPYTYQDYTPLDEQYYMRKTQEWALLFVKSQQ